MPKPQMSMIRPAAPDHNAVGAGQWTLICDRVDRLPSGEMPDPKMSLPMQQRGLFRTEHDVPR